MASQFNNVTKNATADNGNQCSVSSVNILGVAPEEIYTSSTVASFLNRDITSKNLISIVIDASGSNSSLANDTIIFLINNDDNFSLPQISSSWSRPVQGQGGDLLAGIGKTINSITSKVNPTLTASTGIALYNKMAYLPVWTGTQPLSFSLSCTLIATSNAYQQVYQALLMLQFLTLPQTTGSEFVVTAPGSSFNVDALQNLIKSSQQTTQQDPSNNNNLSQLYTGGNQISIGLGSLAFISPIFIKNVNITIPNISTTNAESSLLSRGLASLSGSGSSSTANSGTFPPFATVTFQCESYYPAAHTIGNNFDTYQFMPYNTDGSMTSLFKKG